MKNPTSHCSLLRFFTTLLVLLGMTMVAPAQSTFIRADNNAAMNTAIAWLTNGVTPLRAPTTNDTLVWDSTVSAANTIGSYAANISWGQIIVSNAPAPVEFNNVNNLVLNGRLFNATITGLTLEGNDLSIAGLVNVRSNQSWNLGGRSLTLVQGPDFDINRNLTLAGSGTIFYGRTIDTTSNSVLTIPAGITIQSTNGTGIWRVGQGANLNGTNNQTGGTVIIRRSSAAASMQFCVNTNSSGTYNLSGGTLDVRGIADDAFNRIDNGTISLGINSNVNATINISGTGQMFADIINAATGDNLNAAASINATGGGQLTARNLILGTLGQATLTINNTAVVAITNNLALAGFNGAQSLVVGSGTINLDGGTLITGNMARQAGTNLTGVTNATFNMNGGLLQIQRDNLNFSGANALGAYVGMFVRAGGARIDTAGFSTTNNAPLLHGTVAAVDPGLIKTGLGRLALLGTNTYNGPTTVNAGELEFGTAHDGGGSITLANDSGLAVRVNEVGGTAPVSTLTFGTGGTTTLEINCITNGNPTVPVITATNLVTSGTINVNVRSVGDPLTLTTIDLIDYDNISGSGFPAFTLVGLPLGVTANLFHDTVTKRIQLVLTDVPEALTWSGAADGVWQVGGPVNWLTTIGGIPRAFQVGSPVLFNDTASGTTTITLDEMATPGGFNLVFNNPTKNYSIVGTGGISGEFGLIKTGGGQLTLGVSNSYTLTTSIEGSILRLATNNVIPDGAGRSGLILGNNGTLDLNGFTDAVNGLDGTNTAVVNNSSASPATFVIGSNGASGTYSGIIQNTGGGPLTLVKVGGGTNRLLGAAPNTHTGGNRFLQGTVEITNGTALGPVTAPLSLGGTLRPFGNVNNTAPTFEMNAALTLNLSNNAAVTITAPVIVNTNQFNLTLTGDGSVTLAGSGKTGGIQAQSVALTTTGILTNEGRDVFIGSGASNTASWVINGGKLIIDPSTAGDDIRAGNNLTSTGTLHVTNNAEIFYQDFRIALDDNSTGRVWQTGGVISNLTLTGGEVLFAGNNAAADAGTRAFFNLRGNAKFYTGSLLSIGENGIAEVTLSDTAQIVAQRGATHLGRRTTNASGTLTVGSGTSYTQLTNDLNVGNSGIGILNITGTVTLVPGNNIAVGVNAGASGTINLETGGVLNTSRIIDGAGGSTFNFNGGTLVATGSSTDYMRGISNVTINPGENAQIDTGTNNIRILVGLTGDNTSGLIKTGTGTLTLGGTNNTYSGNTEVNVGSLVLIPPYNGASPIKIEDGANFGVTITSPTVTVTNPASLNLGNVGISTNRVTFDLGAGGNPSNAVLTAGAVATAGTGTISVNVVAGGLVPATFPLISYTGGSLGGSGFSAFVLGTLPRGLNATLVDNIGASVDLQIDSVDQIIWTGLNDNLWDTNTVNWELISTPTAYVEGDSVLFNDDGNNTSINITTNFSPLGLTVSNNIKTYTFNAPSNTGIIGLTPLIKQGTGLLELASSNRYSGPTRISEGTVRFLTNDVLPSTGGLVTVDGLLDVNGFNDTITALAGTGVIVNFAAGPATLSFGGGGGSASYSGSVGDAGLLTLRKTGGGTNVLASASPTWNGGATIDAGTLAFSNDLALGVGPILFEGSATLATRGGARSLANAIAQSEDGEGNFNTTEGDLTLTGPINWYGSADMNKDGSNTMTLSSTATVKLGFDAELAVNGGSLLINGASIVITNDGFRLRATTNFTTVDATIQGAAVLTLQSNANFVVGASGNTNLLTPDLTNILTYASGTTTFEGNGGLFVGSGAANYGVFHHNGGTITFSSINTAGVTIGNGTNTVGIYNLNTGALLVTPRVRENNGVTNSSGDLVPQLVDSTFRINGGTLKASSALSGTNFMFGLKRALIGASGAIVDTDTFDIDFNQALLADGGGALTKNGTGSLALNGVNTYNGGNTTVNAGLLRGKGSVIGNIIGAGKIGGGDSDELGTFTCSGAVSVAGGAVMRVSHVGAVLSNDKVVAAGGGSITHAGQLTLIAVGVDFAAGDSFDLFDAATINGGFSSYNLGLLPPGLSWDARTVSTDGIIKIVKTVSVQVISLNATGNMVTVSGTGGEPSAAYRVLSSTDMTQPLELWSQVGTGSFDGSGNYNLTFAVTPTDQRRFYVVLYP